MLSSVVFLALTVSARRSDYPASALQNEITSLPGLDDKILKEYTMFSGYIDVDPRHNRSLFYWFVESLNDAKNDPVALWTNGGPGCSGLNGMFTEMGPFRPNSDLELYVNNYSWVNVANMLFIEAPAGVGFSFSDNTEDYTTGDNETAIDNYHLIQGWLEVYTNYKGNDFYITSESYGGHYMPTLAQQIVIGNKAGGKPQVNFKGVFVGNPFTNWVENAKGQYATWYGHQLVSYPAYKKWYEDCDDGQIDPYNKACGAAQATLDQQFGDGTQIDPYALDYPVCKSNSKGTSAWVIDERVWFMKHVIRDTLKRPIPGMYANMVDHLERALDDNDLSVSFPPTDYYPCEPNWVRQWFNIKNVQKAIHAKDTKWSSCTKKVHYSIESMGVPMQPTWKWLVENAPDLRITIVSGDDDSVCGTLGTQSWIWDMNYTVDPDYNWKQWFDSNGQFAGFMVKFKDAFNFLTVHSAGHMIPEEQPMRSLESFTMYLKGEI